MPDLRRDPVVGRWVVVSAERARRPSDFTASAGARTPAPCDFCAGRETRTPDEVWAYRPDRSQPNGPGWLVRVVPNKFPALRLDGDVERSRDGLFETRRGLGAHEVVIESPDHEAVLERLSPNHLAEVLRAYRARMRERAKDLRLDYVTVFKNHREPAGASLAHTHSQIIATPMVPERVAEELAGALRHLRAERTCVWCDILRRERGSGVRVIAEDRGFVALAPFASRVPFETWILPLSHESAFEEQPAGALLPLARLIGTVLTALTRRLDDPPYNLVLHSAPLRQAELDHFHWHLEILPRLSQLAGFEWGTAMFINPMPPEEAASALRDALPREQ